MVAEADMAGAAVAEVTAVDVTDVAAAALETAGIKPKLFFLFYS